MILVCNKVKEVFVIFLSRERNMAACSVFRRKKATSQTLGVTIRLVFMLVISGIANHQKEFQMTRLNLPR
jgi:hypothetical protein